MAHDQHDEEYIRSHVHEYMDGGCDPDGGLLHRRAPLTPAQERILRAFSDPFGERTGTPTLFGTMGGSERTAHATTRKTYR